MAETQNWYEVKQNNRVGYALMLFVLRCFPALFMRVLAFPVGFFYWLFAKNARRVSADYFARLSAFEGTARHFSSLKHIISFALNLVEDVQAWAGKVKFQNVHWQNDDVGDLVKHIDAGHGAVILISHLGNAQMLKALASAGESGTERKMRITTISDANISAGFNALLLRINKDSAFHIVSADDIGPETIFLLQSRLEAGEVVVIAGDRVSAHTKRNVSVPFLGESAPLPYGVFLLVALLRYPTYFVNGLRLRDFSLTSRYNMYVRKNTVDFDCPRKEREARILLAAEQYARNLEQLCVRYPYQWYNFFDFWQPQAVSQAQPLSQTQAVSQAQPRSQEQAVSQAETHS